MKSMCLMMPLWDRAAAHACVFARVCQCLACTLAHIKEATYIILMLPQCTSPVPQLPAIRLSDSARANRKHVPATKQLLLQIEPH